MSSDSKVSKNVGRLMVGMVIGFALVALYADIQKLRRNALETVVFTPGVARMHTPTPVPSPTR